ncbi:unnamed protein product [Leptidea sinapis]|uniref:Uncharacterized protein n=1 Tax=Leptidea sinapis TaxID=189913 RepID=A0A5E4Q6V5_9NEOP|nr:unnamed protein product [Leptidea sinapis]
MVLGEYLSRKSDATRLLLLGRNKKCRDVELCSRTPNASSPRPVMCGSPCYERVTSRAANSGSCRWTSSGRPAEPASENHTSLPYR